MSRVPVARRPAPSERSSAELLPLALSRPREAAEAALRLLEQTDAPLDRCYALHALGIVRRNDGDLRGSVRALQAAADVAGRARLSERLPDIEATLATALVGLGRRDEAMARFDEALRHSRGTAAASVRFRRAAMLGGFLGRPDDALVDYRLALRTFRAAGETRWEARALLHRAELWCEQGRYALAEADLERAASVLHELGETDSAASARGASGRTALRRGDLPVALARLEEARRLCEALDEKAANTPTTIALDRAEALLRAGLLSDAQLALQELTDALGSSGRLDLRGLVALRQAEVAYDLGDAAQAYRHADRARRLLRRLGNAREVARADLAACRAQVLAGRRGARLLHRLRALAEQDVLDPADRVDALVLAAGAASGRQPELAQDLLRRAARTRGRRTALAEARRLHAVALLGELRGRRGDVLRACDRGLRVLDEHRLTLGAMEMRAAATAHGTELAALGVRHAAAAGDPELLLTWSERWRATALAVPPVRPPDDDELAADLAALRDVTRRLEEARTEGAPLARLRAEQRRLERSARERTLRSRGTGVGTSVPGVEEVRHLLGDRRLLDLVAVDGRLHVVVLDHHGARSFAAGSLRDATREVEHARFALHRAARDPRLAAATGPLLEGAGRELEQVLLGTAADELADDRAVVVVPPGALHAVPWGLLPSLRHRAVHVAPSAAVWARSADVPAPRGRRTALVRGPGLGSAGSEVPRLASVWPDAVVLQDGAATAEAVMAAMDGAALVHIAAHGAFRADNPMFSCLSLGDGPLTVHDLCRLRRAPHRVVLSACESGLQAPTGADELLGLASALVPLGTAGVAASVVPVHDEATARLMCDLHAALADGATLAEALRRSRSAAHVAGDALAVATAAAYVALGAA